jgi:hypothetical protein
MKILKWKIDKFELILYSIFLFVDIFALLYLLYYFLTKANKRRKRKNFRKKGVFGISTKFNLKKF